MEEMAAQGWQPTLALWEEPGTLLSGLTQVDVTLEDSAQVLVKYSCVGKSCPYDIVQEMSSQGIKFSQAGFCSDWAVFLQVSTC